MSMKTFDEISASIFDKGNKMSWTNAMVRSNAIPLDSTSLFKTFADASQYALCNAVAYEGQLVTVTEDDKQVTYVLDHTVDTGLRRVGPDPEVLSSEISAIASAYAISAENVAREELSVAMTASVGTGDVLSTYTFTQGDKTIGTVSIPKDKVISAAHMVTVTGNYDESQTPAVLSSFTVKWNDYEEVVTDASNPGAYAAIKQAYDGPEGGDGSYIRIVVTNAEAAPVYIAVPKLVDTYIGVKSDTIDVKVVGNEGETREISAIVNQNSIGSEHLTTELSSKIQNVIDTQSADRTIIAILSGDETTEGSVKKALKDAKAYTDALSSAEDAKISAEETARKAADEALDAKLSVYAETQASNALTAAKAYTDALSAAEDAKIAAEETARQTAVENLSTELKGDVSTARSDLSAYAEEVAGTAETNAKAYTDALSSAEDAKIEAARSDLSAYAEEVASTAETNAKAYTDTEIAALSIADTYETKVDATTKLTEAKSYTDTEINDLSVELKGDITAAKAYTDALSAAEDAKIAAEETRAKAAEEAAVATTIALSGEFATISADHETRITANTRAIELLSSAIHFRGTLLESEITKAGDVATEAEIKAALVKKFKPCAKGDLAIYTTNATEYIYTSDSPEDADSWEKLGDEGTYVKKSDYNAKMTELDASDSTLSGMINTEVARATGVEESLSGDLYALSGKYDTFVGTTYPTDKAALDAIDAALRSDINTISGDLDTLEANAILSIKLNDQTFAVANNVAELTISCINCGGADA